MLNAIAMIVYVIIAALCFQAYRSGRNNQSGANKVLLFATFVFAFLVVLRLLHVEAHVHTMFERWLSDSGTYAKRRSFQTPVVIVGVLAAAAYGFFEVYSISHAQGPDRAAKGAGLGSVAMIGLLLLRVVSLHATDRILYHPLRLNWVLDFGLCAVVGLCAWRYGRSQQPNHRRVQGRRGHNRARW